MGCGASMEAASASPEKTGLAAAVAKKEAELQRQPSHRHSKRRVAGRRASALVLLGQSSLADVPKGSEDKQLIVEAFRSRPVFGGLDEDVLKRAADVMYERSFPLGSTIIKQGDDADHFYVVIEGKVQVLIGEKQKRIMGPGSGFGELGVLYGLPRSASCIAHSEVRVWVLDRKPFKHIVVKEQTRKRAEKEKFLGTVPLFSELAKRHPRKLARLADAMDRIEYAEGDTIIRQDEEGHEFFVIARGKVEVSDKQGFAEELEEEDDEAENKPPAEGGGALPRQQSLSRGVGEYFGELSLLKNVPRTATVTAIGSGVSCYVLNRTRFERLINLNDVNFRRYDRRGSLQSAALADLTKEISSPFRERYSDASTALSLADFEQGPTVGIGGYGTVFLGRLRENHAGGGAQGAVFAIKAMAKSELVRESQVENTRQELRILRLCKHPFLCTMYGHWQDARHVYIAMDFIQGGELYSFLRTRRRVKPKAAALYVGELVLALEHLHTHAVCYRDLKPENILLDADGHIQLVDFGLSKIMDAGRTYTLCGTLDYMAPEVLQNKGHDEACDWWSLGNVCFELLTGLPPFYCQNDDIETVEKIMNRKIKWPDSMDGNAKDLIDRLVQVDASKRLGALKNGARDIMNHYFFNGIDWETMLEKGYEMPWVPRKSSMPATNSGEEKSKGGKKKRSKKRLSKSSLEASKWEIEWFRQDAKDNFPAFETSKAQAVLETQQKDFDADSFGAF